jgi:hypothetical protein
MLHHTIPPVSRFRTGDRVVTHTPLDGIPAGTFGTVGRVYISVTGCYDVHLDAYREPRLLFESTMVRVAPVLLGVVARTETAAAWLTRANPQESSPARRV